MAFTQNINTNTSLYGIADPGKFVDPVRLESESLYGRRIHGPAKSEDTLKYTIIIIVISAIIFVTIITIYDLIRNIIRKTVDSRMLPPDDSDSGKAQSIVDTEVLITTGIFVAFCIIFAMIALPLLISLLVKK